MNEIFSIVVSIFSIFLGICAIVQAKRYNQESDKLNADTKKMLSLQLEEIQTIEKKIARYLVKTDENKICLAKDGGYIFKLRIYDKRNKSAILNAFQNLKVKAPVLKRFEIFLEEDQEQFFFDFFYMAETIIKFVNDKYQSLKESFAPNVGKMDLCYLYAYGIAEKEEKEKMEELLLNFMKEDDFHIQERMEEEPIKVERQMDKFKMRG